MAFKQFCTTLQECAEKLEEEIKYNINTFNNQFFANHMDETKLALERAKDYHYKEIVDAIGELIKNIKVILFHRDQIEWLSNETNFSPSDMKRFSYVKRQVYAFTKQDEKPVFSRSEQNLSMPYSAKRERRRTASEISIGTLEAWEKYLDRKKDDEKELIENCMEIKNNVPKRTLSNAKVRKKFVSSTVGGFLDDDKRKHNLDSIVEYPSSNEDISALVEDEIDSTLKAEKIEEFVSNHGGRSETPESTEETENENAGIFSTNIPNDYGKAECDTKCDNKDLPDDINHNVRINDEEIIDEIMAHFIKDDNIKNNTTDDGRINTCSAGPDPQTKPKIVDVILKKNPC